MSKTLSVGLLTMTLSILSLGVPATAAPTPVGVSATALTPRSPALKRTLTALDKGQQRDVIQVKFAENTTVRLRAGHLVSPAGADLSEVDKLLAGVASVSPLFGVDESVLDARKVKAQGLSGRGQADLNQWFRVRVKNGTDIVPLVNALNALKLVETAYPEPVLAPAPVAPDYVSRQVYRQQASVSNGIDAAYAHTIPGGRGSNVRILDIEYGWDIGHEDLSKLSLPGTAVPVGTPQHYAPDHGTATVGVIAADDNGSGVVGLVPDAELHYTNVYSVERGGDLETAIVTATGGLRAGDVMLVEQQAIGPVDCGQTGNGLVPVEFMPAMYDAITAATALGIIVVEAAGNGDQNLDNSCSYGSPFPGGRADSGAIIVGAGGSGYTGCSAARTRMGFSTYGSRVDLQGWGECVTTTGGNGDLYGSTPLTNYTSSFNGTSSASPIVASAAASLSSVAKQRGITLNSTEVRARLKATGSPQVFGLSGNIGPLPNLRAAINALPTGPFTVALSPTSGSVVQGGSTNVTVNTATAAGAAQTVTATHSGAPSGVGVAFSPSSVTTGSSLTMAVTVGSTVTPGTYPITVTLTGNVARSVTYTLTVTAVGGNCTGVAAWNSSTSYVPGNKVKHNNRKWTASWYSTNAPPGAPGSWAVWTDSGAC